MSVFHYLLCLYTYHVIIYCVYISIMLLFIYLPCYYLLCLYIYHVVVIYCVYISIMLLFIVFIYLSCCYYLLCLYIYHAIIYCVHISIMLFPARASEQGNVIGSVRIYIYIYMCTIFFCNSANYFPKIISLSAGENSGDLA